VSIDSPAFVAFVAVALALYHLVRDTPRAPVALLWISLFYASTHFQTLTAALPFALFVGLGYVCLKAARQQRGMLFACMVAGVVASFIYLKRYPIAEFLPHFGFDYRVVGLSYVFFRILHLIIDVHYGSLEATITPRQYLSYILFFPCFASGPLQRYEDFSRQLAGRGAFVLTDAVARHAISRILSGYIKVMLVSAVLLGFLQTQNAALAAATASPRIAPTIVWLAAMLVCTTLYVFSNFSGHMDVVVGLSTLFGFTVPENFDRPFSSLNFLELWSRWHITVSSWFRTYVFNPLQKALVYALGARISPTYLGILAYSVTFFLIGCWHGTSWTYVLFSACLAVGVAVNKLYQVAMRSRDRASYKRLAVNAAYQRACQGLTFAYLSLGLSLIWVDWTPLLARHGGMSMVIGMAAVLLVAVVACGLAALSAAIGRAWRTRPRSSGELRLQPWSAEAWLGLKLFLLTYLFVIGGNQVPALIYQGF
jgi:D-alanyl-lipoteichoic acid acyltransferase DltB (MBOAT superfamily)